VTIHPFDDGNGRIARAIADWALARSEGSPQRFYSMSAQIHRERNDYFDILERAQQGTLDVTPWMQWFLGCLGRAFEGTESTLEAGLRKARFWKRHAQATLNERQRVILNTLLDGFIGTLTTTKWAQLTKCYHDTALRDIQDRMEQGILKKDAPGGRSTSYSLTATEAGACDRALAPCGGVCRHDGSPVSRRSHTRTAPCGRRRRRSLTRSRTRRAQ